MYVKREGAGRTRKENGPSGGRFSAAGAESNSRRKKRGTKKREENHTTPEIPNWSPTSVLIRRKRA